MPLPTPAQVVARCLAASTPLINRLRSLRPALARAAQEVYDNWEIGEDGGDDYGGGGICDDVASAMSLVVSRALGDDVNIVDGGHDGDDHAFIIVLTDTEAVAVDIPPGVYERGGGYSWKKIPGVRFDAGDVVLDPLDRRDFDGEDFD